MPMTALDKRSTKLPTQYCSCMDGPNYPDPHCKECGGSGLPRPLDPNPEVQAEYDADVRAALDDHDAYEAWCDWNADREDLP